MTDFSQIKFRASSWGNLMTEPREKAAKERGELSKSCQKELIKIYNQEVYGRKKDITAKQIRKGIAAEDDSILLFGRVENKTFIKNIHRLENDWFCGCPDIYEGEDILQATEIHDIKTSWDLDSFTPKLIEGIDDGYEYQLQCYFSLTGAQKGSVAYCLVSAPIEILMEEQKRLLFASDVISEESPEYQLAAAEMAKNMVFEDIDYRERVIKHVIYRDDEIIQKMKDKVPALRKWLSDFHELHMNQYPKTS